MANQPGDERPHGDDQVDDQVDDLDDDSLDFVLRKYHESEKPDSDQHQRTSPGFGHDEPGLPSRRRYKMLGKIAHGGMGVVHYARDIELGRDLAMKVLHKRHIGKPGMVHRFIEEAQICGQLQHPGIVPLYELGLQADQSPYFTMKLVAGKTLAELLEERSDPASERRRFVAIFEQICQTMAYAHARGVIHRDLKPSNIMVGAFGEVQVMDWGLAKVLDGDAAADEGPPTPFKNSKEDSDVEQKKVETVRSGSSGSQSQAGSVLGTPAYMSPEQARGETEEIDACSDVFSLGAILCEILTGRPPYSGSTRKLIHDRAARGDLQEALQRLETCGADAELVRIASRCLAASNEERPQNAEGLAETINAYLGALEERTRAAELTAAEARGKAVQERRARRLTLALAASVLLAVLLGGGGYLWVEEDRRSRSRDLALKVDQALREAQLSRGKAEASPVGDLMHWERALAAARSAQSLAQQIEVDDGTLARTDAFLERLQARAARATADSRMVERLDALRLEHAHHMNRRKYLVAAIDAFRAYGIDVVSLTPEEASEHVVSSSIRLVLTDALETLALGLRHAKKETPTDWKKIARIIDLSDRNPQRSKLRDAILAGQLEELRAVTASSEIHEYPARLLSRLAVALGRAGDSKLSLSLHRRARSLSPRDYWITHNLGAALQNSRPPRLDEALRFFTALVSIRETWDAWHHLAIIRIRQKRPRDAIEYFQKAVELNPGRAILRVNLGRAQWNAGDPRGALRSFLQATEVGPKHAVAHMWLGHALSEKPDYEGALAAYKRAVELNPQHFDAQSRTASTYWRKGELDMAIREFRKAIKLRGDVGRTHWQLGMLYEQTKRLQRALDSYEKAVELDENLAGAWQSLGTLLSNKKRDYDAAIEAFKKVVELEPKNHVAYFNLGVTHDRKGNLDASIRAFRNALQIKPEAVTFHSLGQTYRQKGDLDQTLDAWVEAVRLEPENPSYLFDLGLLYSVTGKPGKAMSTFRDLLTKDPRHGPAYYEVSRLLYKKRDLDGAIEALRKAIRLNPNNPAAHNNLALILGMKGEVDAAIAEWQEVARLKPTNASAQNNIGALYVKSDRPTLALPYLEKAVRLDKSYANAFFNLGLAYDATGDLDRALENYEQAVRHGSNDAHRQRLEESRRRVELNKRLPDVLRGRGVPTRPGDLIEFAALCYDKKLYAASAGFYKTALAANDGLTTDERFKHGYNAACSAALTACRAGSDTASIDDPARAAWRKQALVWLRSALSHERKVLASGGKDGPERVVRSLEHWKRDSDLAGVRDKTGLARLPAPERRACEALWANVDELLKKAASAK